MIKNARIEPFIKIGKTMVEIPEDIKGYLKQVQKYHFWLLALLMPLVLVPLAFTADAKLLNEINTRSSAVKSKVDSINSVAGKKVEGLEEFGHPQSDWAEVITRSNNTLREQMKLPVTSKTNPMYVLVFSIF